MKNLILYNWNKFLWYRSFKSNRKTKMKHSIWNKMKKREKETKGENEMMKNMRQKYRRINENWHRSMNFQIFDKNIRDEKKRKQTKWKKNIENERRKRHKRMRTIDVNNELRRIVHDKQIEFRKFQKNVVEIIMRDQKRILIIMFIEKEKSLLFMLSTFCDEKKLSL